ncbi:MAG: asparagine synthase (glutamine-hydrolyzing) [Bacteroidetes bacterium]|nr:asparagine synthase (glutamine-hydrolyzing) [Bacteroidota bacterium]MBS1539744.1 asparagine synthase (glutamine-hydrolyzing) [Bacteroidota bacterium]
MCRIAGIAAHPSRQRTEAVVAMLKSLAHGGPDDEGIFEDEHVALGHRRLSIIDLSQAGHQPMLSEDGNLVITFNGEIYNFQALRKELETFGQVFKTHSDTEVILQAYRLWGTEAFHRFEGIFAFALYDKQQNKLLLVRDQVGVKPLYYSFRNDQLIFSSEVRAFKAIDPNWPESHTWRTLFLAFGSLPHPTTTLRGVYGLEPGTWMAIDLHNFSKSINRYHFPVSVDNSVNYGSALELTRAGVMEAVKKNLIADAPLGVFLSGGIDSSLLTLLADKLQDGVKSISINFDDAQFDERPFQKRVLECTQNTDHIAHRVTARMFWDSLDDIWCAMDQPTNDGVNTYFVSRCAHRDGLKTVLSGLGADEVFGGYASFGRIRMVKYLRSMLPFRTTTAHLLSRYNESLRRLVFLDIRGPVGDYLFLRGIHTPDAIASLLQCDEQEVWDILQDVTIDLPDNIRNDEYVSHLEFKVYMTNQLLKDTDMMSMWHGLEVRVPFLDTELLKKIYSVPAAVRYPQHSTKKLLTDALSGVLPEDIVNRRKKGFTFPLSVWMKEDIEKLKDLCRPDHRDSYTQDFLQHRIHWSKYWSLAVLNQFR